MGQANRGVDAVLAKAGAWAAEMRALREIALGLPLDEEVKWGRPCYSAGGKNVVLLHPFKEYCALLFFKGALMADPHGQLVRQTNNMQSARQLRFTGLAEIAERRATVAAYIEEAIRIEASGAKAPKATPATTPTPPEFEDALASSPPLNAAFASLTPGRQRAYLLHFGAAKQSTTRIARIAKCEPLILAGKGLDD